MNKFLRMTALVASAAAATIVSTPASAQQAQANARARVMRPLLLESTQNLDLGIVVLSGAGAWSGATVSVDQAGARTCTNTNVTCSGTVSQAIYRVRGTNNQTVTVAAPDVILSDGTNNLTLDLDAPTTVALGASGNAGVLFGVGGSITVASTTPDGVYTGTLAVTVQYQ